MKRAALLCLHILLGLSCIAPAYAAKPEPVPINTAGWADQPFISADGKRLYFTYSRWSLFSIYMQDKPTLSGPDRPGLQRVDDINNALSEGTIYMAERKADGGWKEPVAMPFNIPGHNSGAVEAGKSVYFSHSDGPGKDSNIYVSHKEGENRWSKPERLPDTINSDANDDNPYVSSTEDGIWFSSNRRGGFGGKDLYFSQKIDGKWTKAVNMGPVINSAVDEDQPWVNPDGSGTIFFNRGTTIQQAQWKNSAFTAPQIFAIPAEDIVGRISFTADGTEAFFAAADIASKHMRIMHMKKELDGSWGAAEPVD